MEDSEISKKDKLIFTVGIVVAILIMTSTGLLFYEYLNKKIPKQTAQKTEVKVPENKTPVADQDYKDKPIQILNASGVSGAASKFAKKLEGLGYKQVTTGNYETVITGNLFFGPEDGENFKKDLESLGFTNYKFTTSELVKVVIGK